MDVVFLDVNLPDGNGLEAMKTIRQMPAAPEIIIITGSEDVDGAELAMHSRAWDYIPKTGSYKKFVFALDRALEYRCQKQARHTAAVIRREGIIGDSSPVMDCLDQVAKAAKSDIPVLITGETGTGKEMFSRAIHANSPRASGPFVVVDCAAMPARLVESTLFGHVKGAFTGADTPQTGLMKAADKGTLFLDEVGELPLDIQQKFLRSIQERRFRPVGAAQEVQSDFRLVCATHRDLKQMVTDRVFRQDLYYRLFSMHLPLPPLRDRKTDIPLLVQSYLSGKKTGSPGPGFTVSQDFTDALQDHDWPGNVRELIHTLDLVCSQAGPGATLFSRHLPENIRTLNIRHRLSGSTPEKAQANTAPGLHRPGSYSLTFKAYMDQTKQAYLHHLLSDTQGNIADCCKRSGLSRSQIYRLLQQYGLKNT
jgi:two-component system, NtrC family, response regulator